MSLKQLKGIRWAVRATLALGVTASTIANILHADDNPVSQAIAAWPPLALLLTIELISRVPVHRPLLSAVRVIATVVIAGIAAWVSYWHMVGVIARYGETGAGPYLIPLTVDGLVVVASVCLVELSGRIQAAAEPDHVTPHPPSRTQAPTTVPDGDKRPALAPIDRHTFRAKDMPEGPQESAATKRVSRNNDTPKQTRSHLPILTGLADGPSAERLGRERREVKVPQTAEACARWVACWIAMCRDGLDTGPISLTFEAEARQRYGWGVKQIRDVRNAATSGQLRAQAGTLGVTLPTAYVDPTTGIPAADKTMKSTVMVGLTG